ncbi:MAG UNVERIFIED_CONTAM: type II secretion system F family protein [Planctomycetaceae bacterium]
MMFLLIVLLTIALGLLIARRNSRLAKLRNQLPDVVSLMARSSRAGLAIEEAFLLCERMARGRLQSELQVCRSQLELGRSLSGVMESFARRVQLRELGLLSTLLSVHRQTGGSLADALDRLSSLLRDRIAFSRADVGIQCCGASLRTLHGTRRNLFVRCTSAHQS